VTAVQLCEAMCYAGLAGFPARANTATGQELRLGITGVA
jgi:hypothetical protein